MLVANLDNRLALVRGDRALDVEWGSEGSFGSDPQAVFDDWDAFAQWGATADFETPGRLTAAPRPAGPTPTPGVRARTQLRDARAGGGARAAADAAHVHEVPSCIVGPDANVTVATDRVDWEVELVLVIGRTAHNTQAADAWDHVAGVTVGQDISARDVQMTGSPPQFSLGKSFPGFGPTGPWLATPDELPDRDNLELGCAVNGEQMQRDRTSSMLFSVSETVARLSAICPLLPGDLVFTGTPAGVGNRMDPPRYLRPGDELVSTIEGIGSITTRFV